MSINKPPIKHKLFLPVFQQFGGRGEEENTFRVHFGTVYYIVLIAKSSSVTSLTNCFEYSALQQPTSSLSGDQVSLSRLNIRIWFRQHSEIVWASKSPSQRSKQLGFAMSDHITAGIGLCARCLQRVHIPQPESTSASLASLTGKIAFLLPIPSSNSLSDKTGVIKTSSGGSYFIHM